MRTQPFSNIICELYLIENIRKQRKYNMINAYNFRLVDQYKKIGRFTDILEYFSTREWIFSNQNVQSLWNSLNNDDKALFPFDIKNMHWEEYLDTYHKGIMTFLLKEGQDKLPVARKRLHGYALSNNLYT